MNNDNTSRHVNKEVGKSYLTLSPEEEPQVNKESGEQKRQSCSEKRHLTGDPIPSYLLWDCIQTSNIIRTEHLVFVYLWTHTHN